jgi:thioredoxin reductase (NADPH)
VSDPAPPSANGPAAAPASASDPSAAPASASHPENEPAAATARRPAPPSALYDTAIVGGGPAGLAAALHLGWHGRRVVVVDRTSGPLFFTLELLHNVPGMPALAGSEIQKRLRAQAREMRAELVRGDVQRIERIERVDRADSIHHADGLDRTDRIGSGESDFLLHGGAGEQWRARSLLLATGVARFHPLVDGDFTPCFTYAGKGNLFYCTDCEAPEVAGKDTVVIAAGSAEAGAAMALALRRYTDRLRLLVTGDPALSPARAERLAAEGIAVRGGTIHRLLGEKRLLTGLELADGTTLAAEAFFVSSPARGRTDLARQLGVEMTPEGHHAVPRSQRGDTNVPGVWVAGDLRPMTQQVAVAMGTGNIAAVMIDQHLRRP